MQSTPSLQVIVRNARGKGWGWSVQAYFVFAAGTVRSLLGGDEPKV